MLQRTSQAAVGVPVLFLAAALQGGLCRAQGDKPAAADNPQMQGLPTFLLPVPGGTTTIGMTQEQLMRAVMETISPTKPERALAAPEKVVRALKNTASELGQNKEVVETFLLGKWPVKNSEYEVFVKTLREQKQKVRPPYHWWRYGQKEDYEKRLEDINKEFKADGKYGPLLYWERHGDEFPFELKDENGKSIADQPVTYVSYRDAIRFAGWLGMRLPTEAERTRAARGDTNNVWLWGSNKDLGDAFTDKSLQYMQLANARDRVLKSVGTVKFLTGPYGHLDLNGQVWEYVAQIGFRPIGDPKKFDAEWAALMKDKIGAQVQNRPAWKDDHVIIKGGSYLSSGDPIQLHIDSRDKLTTNDYVESVGLRLAKSLKPGYDLIVSWVSAGYDQSLFASDQSVDNKNMVGVERYLLAENGFPKEYHAFAFAPVSALTAEKNASLPKLEDKSQLNPIAIGTIAVTEKVLTPALPANQLYTIAFRKGGTPKDLAEALKVGVKEVQAAAKKKGDKEEGEAEKKKGPDWKSVIGKYGLTEKDLEAGEPNFVRLNGYEVPIEKDAFLFHNNEGKFVAHVLAGAGLTAGSLVPSDLTFDTAKTKEGDKARIELRACVPLQAGQKKGVSYKLEFTMDCAPNSPATPWRLPQAGNAPAPNSGAGANNGGKQG